MTVLPFFLDGGNLVVVGLLRRGLEYRSIAAGLAAGGWEGAYPLLRVRRLAVSPLRRVTLGPQSNQRALPLHSVPRWGSACPNSGIPAGLPTAQYLRSAIVVNGGVQIKIKIKSQTAALRPA
ncbi:hypothetical protein PproGo58_39570 [Pseudomonas protegens]|nr:hypothetical protein PproGo58_39570 [Pseudomonas protegens]